MSTLSFDRAGRLLVSIDAVGITIMDVGTRATMRVAVEGARSAVGFDDQVWVATAANELVRFDRGGRQIGAVTALPYAERGALVAAPCGAAAAVWSTTAVTVDATGAVMLTPLAGAHAVIPITGRRGVVVTGAQLTMPTGLVLDLPAGSVVAGGAALADGKLLALVLAGGGKRQLAVVSITSAEVKHRQPLASGDVRFAAVRGLAAIRVAPRAVRLVDLRTGKEVACVALDRDLADFAIDAEGRWLALRNTDGTVELREISRVAIGARPTHTPEVVSPASEGTAAPVVALRGFAVTARGRYARGTFSLPEHASDELVVRAPATGEVLAVFPCGADDVEVAVASARGAAPTWAAIGLPARLGVLERIGAELAARADELAGVMQRELGRSAAECARELAGLAPRTADLCAVAGEQLVEVAEGETRLRPRAHGVVAVITPVMLPLGTAHLHVMSALIAGNAVVWKPSPLVAASAQIYAEALHAAGLPPGVVNLVHGGAEVGGNLVAHAGIDALVFAGSRDTARRIRRATCDRLELATAFHLGAKNVAVVAADADLDVAAAAIAEAAFLTAGQRSTAIGRVLVGRAQLAPLVAALARATGDLVARPGFLAPMFSAERHARFTARIAAAETAGARRIALGDHLAVTEIAAAPRRIALGDHITEIAAGARRIALGDHIAVTEIAAAPRRDPIVGALHVAPSIHVVDDAAAAADYLRDELFGPDLAVEPVDDIRAAVAALAGHAATFVSLFGGDLDTWQQVRDEVDAGAVLWNHSPLAVSARLGFAARGTGMRGARGIAGLTRTVADCRAITAPIIAAAEPQVVERTPTAIAPTADHAPIMAAGSSPAIVITAPPTGAPPLAALLERPTTPTTAAAGGLS